MNILEFLISDQDLDSFLHAASARGLLRGRTAVFIWHEDNENGRVYNLRVRRWDQSKPWAPGDPAAEYLAAVWRSHDYHGVVPVVYIVPAGARLSADVVTARQFTAAKLHPLPWRETDQR